MRFEVQGEQNGHPGQTRLSGLNVCGHLALVSFDDAERQAMSSRQSIEVWRVEVAPVIGEVFAAFVQSNEAVVVRIVEEFHSTKSHFGTPYPMI